jgi:hypothetical protein
MRTRKPGGGRPPRQEGDPPGSYRHYTPTEEDRRLVCELVGAGWTLEAIAPLFSNPATRKPLTVGRLKRHFHREIRIAPLLTRAKLSRRIFAAATGEEPVRAAEIRKLLDAAAMLAALCAEDAMGAKDDGLTDGERVERLMVLYERLRARLAGKADHGAGADGRLDPVSRAAEPGDGEQG